MTREPSATIATKWRTRSRGEPATTTAAGGSTLLPALDWRGHRVGYTRRRCRICGTPAYCTDEDGSPCHKVCAEGELVRQLGWDEAVTWVGQQVAGRTARKRKTREDTL